MISFLPSTIPLFVPDIPGYGKSSPSRKGHDKRTIGRAILDALSSLIGNESSRAIVIAGHDRGARICHRLAADDANEYRNLQISGTILLDIVPTLTQWESFSKSKVASGNFHWPMLANVEIATAMIKAYGGDNWCRTLIERGAGANPEGLDFLGRFDAVDVYCNYFKQESTIRASCEDYRAGAEEDVEEEKADQESGKRIRVATLVMYSADYLGSRFNVERIWQDWCHDQSLLKVKAIGDGVGHYLAEEAPYQTAMEIADFWKTLHKK